MNITGNSGKAVHRVVLSERGKALYAERMNAKPLVGVRDYLVCYIIATDSYNVLKKADNERISELEKQTGYEFSRVAKYSAELKLRQIRNKREKSIMRADA